MDKTLKKEKQSLAIKPRAQSLDRILNTRRLHLDIYSIIPKIRMLLALKNFTQKMNYLSRLFA